MVTSKARGDKTMSEVQHWICSYCGRRTITYSKEIRPDPNICHKKGKTKDGRTKPHSWVRG